MFCRDPGVGMWVSADEVGEILVEAMLWAKDNAAMLFWLFGVCGAISGRVGSDTDWAWAWIGFSSLLEGIQLLPFEVSTELGSLNSRCISSSLSSEECSGIAPPLLRNFLHLDLLFWNHIFTCNQEQRLNFVDFHQYFNKWHCFIQLLFALITYCLFLARVYALALE